LSAGASGYILKKTSPHKMLDAIKELYEGGSPMSNQIARKVVAAFQHRNNDNSFGGSNNINATSLSTLSNREKEILEFIYNDLMLANADWVDFVEFAWLHLESIEHCWTYCRPWNFGR